MHRKPMRLLAAMAVLALALGTTPLSAESHPSVPETETLYIAAGCPPSDETGTTCTSTRWLGTQPGDASSNFLTATTPVDEVYARLGEEPNWRDYPSDTTLRDDGYVLDATRPLVATVRITARGPAIENTVHARISARIDGKNVRFPAQSQKLDPFIQDSREVTFEFDLSDVEGKTLTKMTFEMALHGVNAQSGYIDQQGGSTVEIPHLVEEDE